MRETRTSGSEGGGAKPIVSPYPYHSHRPVFMDTGFRRYDNESPMVPFILTML